MVLARPFGHLIVGILLSTSLLLGGCRSDAQRRDAPVGDWRVYKASATSSSYSTLDQIDRDNVDQLEVAWTYRTGDLDKDNHPGSGIETNPIIVDDVLYGLSPPSRFSPSTPRPGSCSGRRHSRPADLQPPRRTGATAGSTS